MLMPKETLDRFDRILINDEEFRKIHHLTVEKGKKETVESHIKYLKGLTTQKYQSIKSNNHIVALRLQCLENFENQGFSRKSAIDNCIVEYPFLIKPSNKSPLT